MAVAQLWIVRHRSLFMTKEAHDIVEELRIFNTTQKSGAVYEVTGALSFLAFRTARLQVLLAEEQEQASLRMEQQTDRLVKQTDRLVDFTKGLYWFTAVLIGLGLVQLVVAFFCRP